MPLQTSFSFILFTQYLHVVAASSNDTIVSGWVKDPEGRGTFTILSSCLLTLSLCVYTTIHLNVQPQERTEAQSWVETSKWVGFGILAPELLVFIAWRQYASAMNLDRTVRELKESMSSSKTTEKNVVVSDKEHSLHNPWSTTHSFYANMGGFVFDFGDEDLAETDRFTRKHTRLTLTPRGVVLLMRCGYLPNVSEKEIMDKNKTDNVSKLLSILQALWMFAQIVGRLSTKLPVTLLEVTTLAHIICALLVYLLWWNKPKLINEPTKLKGEWAAPICAYMYMSSQISGWRRPRPGILKKYWKDPEISVLTYNPPPTRSTPPDHESAPEDATTNADDASATPNYDSSRSHSQYGTFTPRPAAALTNKGLDTETSYLEQLESRLKSSQDLQAQRWTLAAKAMTLYPAIRSRVTTHEVERIPSAPRSSQRSSLDEKGCNSTPYRPTTTYLKPTTEELVDSSIGNWARENLLRNMSGFVMGMVVWSASMAYGGVHLAAWNNFFPTPVERLLWRCSALCIAASGLTWILINLSAHTSPVIKNYWKRVAALRADMFSLVGLGGLATLCGLAYVLSRLYLVVESLISLRTLPKGAFDTMEWSQLVPHL